MAVSKVILNGVTEIDLTGDTATAQDVAQGKTFHLASGVQGAGTATGGSEAADEKDVNFYDYDGTIVYSYTATEFANLSALPANPSHNGLTAQGWNWTLANAKIYVSNYGKLNIGQAYVTASGDTEIDVEFCDSARLSPLLSLGVNGTVTIDWGDNTSQNTVTGSSLTTLIGTAHTYANKGAYTIKIHKVSGSFTIIGSSSITPLYKNTTANQNIVYANCIRNVRIGTGITNIGTYAFNSCSGLRTITIPTNIVKIDSYAFYKCYSLEFISIPSTVSTIGSYTFDSCTSLTAVSLARETPLVLYMFNNCYSLRFVAVTDNTSSIAGNAFQSCRSLYSVIVPSTITSFGTYVFSSCGALATLTIPSSVSTISNYLCSSCSSLASITIPSSITKINKYAFSYCYGLSEIHFKPTTPPTLDATSVFSSLPTDCKIYVPTGKLSAYTSADYYPDSNTYTYIEE